MNTLWWTRITTKRWGVSAGWIVNQTRPDIAKAIRAVARVSRGRKEVLFMYDSTKVELFRNVQAPQPGGYNDPMPISVQI